MGGTASSLSVEVDVASPFHVLPDELLLEIFSHGSPKDCLNWSHVCRRWYFVCTSECLWANFLRTSLCNKNPAWLSSFEDHKSRYRAFATVFWPNKSEQLKLWQEPPDRQKHDGVVKALMIGNYSVGKSSVLNRISQGRFLPFHYGIGVDFCIRTVRNAEVNRTYKLQLWDTAGQERFRRLPAAYYRRASVVFICFAANAPASESIDGLQHWHDELLKQCEKPPPVVLMGCKCDTLLTPETPDVSSISLPEIECFAAAIGVPLILTSAKDDVNIDLLLQLAAHYGHEYRLKFPHPELKPSKPKQSKPSWTKMGWLGW
eukprot:m.174944 g.174944  ORF g.174944 m.174944 type:complete len:317 (-) comp25290_c1_seq2:27-977(-)